MRKKYSSIASSIIAEMKFEKRLRTEGERRKEYAKKSSMHNDGRRNVGENQEKSAGAK